MPSSSPPNVVSRWPQYMRVGPPPVPARTPYTLKRSGSTSCSDVRRPAARNRSARYSATARSPPIGLGMLMRSTVRSRRDLSSTWARASSRMLMYRVSLAQVDSPEHASADRGWLAGGASIDLGKIRLEFLGAAPAGLAVGPDPVRGGADLGEQLGLVDGGEDAVFHDNRPADDHRAYSAATFGVDDLANDVVTGSEAHAAEVEQNQVGEATHFDGADLAGQPDRPQPAAGRHPEDVAGREPLVVVRRRDLRDECRQAHLLEEVLTVVASHAVGAEPDRDAGSQQRPGRSDAAAELEIARRIVEHRGPGGGDAADVVVVHPDAVHQRGAGPEQAQRV